MHLLESILCLRPSPQLELATVEENLELNADLDIHVTMNGHVTETDQLVEAGDSISQSNGDLEKSHDPDSQSTCSNSTPDTVIFKAG